MPGWNPRRQKSIMEPIGLGCGANEVSAELAVIEGGTRNVNELTRFDGYAGPLGVVTRGRGEMEIADSSAASCRRA